MPEDTNANEETSSDTTTGSPDETPEDTTGAPLPAEESEQMENAMADPQKQSRISQVLSALAGEDFRTIVDAITGSSNENFDQVLSQVRSNNEKVAAAEARVREREAALTAIDQELDRLRQENAGLDEQINRIKSRITVRTPEDAASLSGADLLDPAGPGQ